MARGGFPGALRRLPDGTASRGASRLPGKPPRAIKWVINIHPWYYLSPRGGDWVFALLAIGLVPLFLETFVIWQWLQPILPPPALEWLPIGLAAGLAVGVLAWSVSVVGRGLVTDSPWRRLAWLVVGLASAVAALQLTDPDFPAKKVHLFQYALLALIVRRAYGTRVSGLTLTVASIITAGVLGVHDELLQGLHPQRQFGVVDILVNALSAAAGACAATAAARSVVTLRRTVDAALVLSVAASLAGVAILVASLSIDPTAPILIASFAGAICWTVLTRTGVLRRLTAFVAVVIGLSALTVVAPLAARMFEIPFG